MMELQLAHFSVQQYLQSKQIQATFREMSEVGGMFQNGLDEIRARGSITRICLAYLSHLAEQHAVGKIRIGIPLAQYSAQYWVDHERPAETEKGVQERILNFLLQQRQAYAAWGELFGLDLPWAEEPRRYMRMASPLYYASLAGLQHTIKVLLEEGVNVNPQGGRHGNALQAASYEGHKEIVQLLLEKGADVNAQGGRHGNALRAASYRGHKEIVRLLLDKGADVNAQGGPYANALGAASYHGHVRTGKLLLEKGANITITNNHGWTPLHAAAFKDWNRNRNRNQGTAVNTGASCWCCGRGG